MPILQLLIVIADALLVIASLSIVLRIEDDHPRIAWATALCMMALLIGSVGVCSNVQQGARGASAITRICTPARPA